MSVTIGHIDLNNMDEGSFKPEWYNNLFPKGICQVCHKKPIYALLTCGPKCSAKL